MSGLRRPTAGTTRPFVSDRSARWLGRFGREAGRPPRPGGCRQRGRELVGSAAVTPNGLWVGRGAIRYTPGAFGPCAGIPVVALAQRQSSGLWFRRLWVRNPHATPTSPFPADL